MRVERTWSTTHLDYKDDKCPHGLRVGWSTPDTSLLLGEDSSPDRFLEELSGHVLMLLLLLLLLLSHAR